MNLVRSWPQGQAGATPLGWSRPQPLMPPRIEGWPRGVVPSGNAEALLETAVAYWDASKYRPGDRFLRNQGVAGELLDLRLGSSVVANTNDPLWLGPEATGYVYLPGVGVNNLTVPHSAGTQSGDVLDVRVDIEADNWTSGGLMAGKSTGAAAATASWIVGNTTSNRQYFLVSDGTNTILWRPTILNAAPFTTSTRLRLRFTYTRNTGSGSYAMGIDYSTDFGTALSAITSWTNITSTTSASIGAMLDVNAVVTLGAEAATAAGFAGRYRGLVLAVNGTTILDIDCDAITSGSQTSFTATTGQTVTINRSTSGRKSVAMPSRWNGGRPCFLFGTDDYMEVQDAWQHQLLNFGQGDSFTVLAVARRWDTQATEVMISKKMDTTASSAGWIALFASANRYSFYPSDGITRTALDNSAASSAARLATVGVVDTPSRTVSASVNNTRTSFALLSSGAIGNALPVYVGRTHGSTFSAMEFTAAAVFRRALTSAEITTLSTYWGS